MVFYPIATMVNLVILRMSSARSLSNKIILNIFQDDYILNRIGSDRVPAAGESSRSVAVRASIVTVVYVRSSVFRLS